MSDNPLAPDKIANYVHDVARGGQELAVKAGSAMNEISIRRAMQVGYMLACQDHGLPVPHMPDPAEDFDFG